MRHFDVIVCPKMVTVLELEVPSWTYDVSANVDGDKYLYRITKQAHIHMKSGWRERGYVQAFYHAKNAGNHVTFNRVDAPGRTRKKRRSVNQMRLFD